MLLDDLKDLKNDMAKTQKEEKLRDEKKLRDSKENKLKSDFESFMKNSGIKKN